MIHCQTTSISDCFLLRDSLTILYGNEMTFQSFLCMVRSKKGLPSSCLHKWETAVYQVMNIRRQDRQTINWRSTIKIPTGQDDAVSQCAIPLHSLFSRQSDLLNGYRFTATLLSEGLPCGELSGMLRIKWLDVAPQLNANAIVSVQ